MSAILEGVPEFDGAAHEAFGSGLAPQSAGEFEQRAANFDGTFSKLDEAR